MGAYTKNKKNNTTTVKDSRAGDADGKYIDSKYKKGNYLDSKGVGQMGYDFGQSPAEGRANAKNANAAYKGKVTPKDMKRVGLSVGTRDLSSFSKKPNKPQ